MMKYQANPVIVDAFKIVSVGEPSAHDGIGWWSVNLALDNGENVTADYKMLARYVPAADDYWVVQSDGYIYLNPKDVFERKYSPVTGEIAA
jgi:hypothetical protein